MTVYRVQFALGMIIAVTAVASMWLINRRTTLAAWCGVVETVAALAMIGTVMWRDDSQWVWLPVWVLTACAAAANGWLIRVTDRRRRERWRGDLAALVALERARREGGSGRPIDDCE